MLNQDSNIPWDSSKSEEELEEQSLRAFKTLLVQVDKEDSKAEEHLRAGSRHGRPLDPIFSAPYRIWHLDELKSYCIRYRLVLISSDQYQSSFSYSLLNELKRLGQKMNNPISQLCVMVPTMMGKPRGDHKRGVLLAQMSDGRFAEIGRWGLQASFARRILMWPVQNLKNSISFIVSLAFLSAFVLLPESVIVGPHDSHSFALRMVFFFYMLLALSGMSVLYGFSKVKSFNEDLWEKTYSDLSRPVSELKTS
jgi:hypothetical protein